MAKKKFRQLRRKATHKLDRKRLQALALTAGAGFIAERLVFNGLERGWRLVSGGDPPTDPDAPDVSWKEALAWTAITGLAVATVSLAARRGAAAGWERFQHG